MPVDKQTDRHTHPQTCSSQSPRPYRERNTNERVETNVGFLERRRVVDTVPGHGDDGALSLAALHGALSLAALHGALSLTALLGGALSLAALRGALSLTALLDGALSLTALRGALSLTALLDGALSLTALDYDEFLLW